MLRRAEKWKPLEDEEPASPDLISPKGFRAFRRVSTGSVPSGTSAT
jgi:hypothetical protein